MAYQVLSAAELLRARLFQSDTVPSIENDIRQSPVGKVSKSAKKELDDLLRLSIPELQNLVRVSFLAMPHSRQSPAVQYLIGSVIFPAIQVVYRDSSAMSTRERVGRAQQLARLLTQGNLSEAEDTDIRLACNISCGVLQSHPLIHGLLVMITKKIEREQRGIFTLKGLRLTDHERALVSEAGVTLSMAAANKALLKEFAMLSQKPRIALDALPQKHALPDPFVAVNDPQLLQDNAELIDRLFPLPSFAVNDVNAGDAGADGVASHVGGQNVKVRRVEGCQRRLVLAVDKTYLLRQVNAIQVRQGRGLVGGCWSEDAAEKGQNQTSDLQTCQDRSFIAISNEAHQPHVQYSSMKKFCTIDGLDMGRLELAGEMMECILWDPSNPIRENPRFSLAAIPMSTKSKKEQMLHLIGLILYHGGSGVRSVVLDNHASHALVKAALLGQFAAPSEIPFFGSLEYQSLPHNCLSNFDYKIPVYDDECIFFLNGPSHVQKNYVGAARSSCRTLYFGQYWCDMCTAQGEGLSPGAFAGFDKQSDREAAMFLNPFHLVHLDDEASLDFGNLSADINIPWSLRGSLLFNLTGALLQASVMHRDMNNETRLECAMTSHVILDLAQYLAHQREADWGLRKNTLWLQPITQQNMQQLAGCMAIMLKSLPRNYIFTPWKMCELSLEQFFGLIRSQHQTCQLSVRDYLAASVKTAMQFSKKQLKGQSYQRPPCKSFSRPLSDEEFQQCADGALTSAVQLVHLISGVSKQQLRRAYVTTCSSAPPLLQQQEAEELRGLVTLVCKSL